MTYARSGLSTSTPPPTDMTEADIPTKQKLWGGRFTGKTDPLMHAFNQSLSYDKRMYSADIRGSIAYGKSLALVGLLTEDEKDKIVGGLTRVEEEWKNGTVRSLPCCGGGYFAEWD